MPASKPIDVDAVSYLVAIVELGLTAELVATTAPDGKNLLTVRVNDKILRSWSYKETKHVATRS